MGKTKNLKRPSSKSSKLYKIPDIASPQYDNNKPIFSFIYMKYGCKQCVSRCAANAQSSIAKKLIQISQFAWKEIFSIKKDSLGFEKIPSDSFSVPLPDYPYATPEVKLLTFRYSDSGRIAGYRKDDVFHILIAGENLYPH